MSGGVAYVYDPDGQFRSLCNTAMVDLEPIGPATPAQKGEEGFRPVAKAPAVENNGMGDMLRFDAERLRILVERHLLHTGSARARALLDNWSEELKHFVKVMPTDYRRALLELNAGKSAVVAAE
jgi:glutamate synthase (NADPH/NADH) large chain